jgi:hypothetical protein
MSTILDQKANSVASLQRYQNAKAAAARIAAKAKRQATRPALSHTQDIVAQEHAVQAKLSTASLERFKAAKESESD